MKSMARFGSMSVVALLAAHWSGWNDVWYLFAGLVTVGVPCLLALVWRSCSKRPEELQSDVGSSGMEGQSDVDAIAVEPVEQLRESLILGGGQGIVLGIVLSLYLAASFTVLQQIPWI